MAVVTTEQFRKDCRDAVSAARDGSLTVLSREDVVDVCVSVALGLGIVEVFDEIPVGAE